MAKREDGGKEETAFGAEKAVEKRKKEGKGLCIEVARKSKDTGKK